MYSLEILSFIELFRFQSDRKRRELQMRTQVNQKLEESGERERLDFGSRAIFSTNLKCAFLGH